MLKQLFGILTAGAVAASPATAHHIFGDGIFSLDAPAILARNQNSEAFQLAAPDDLAAITATAYAKSGGSINELCEYRFSSVEDFYKPVSAPRRFKGPKVSGKLQSLRASGLVNTSPLIT